MNHLNHEIVNIHHRNGELWGNLLNKNFERLQQLIMIAPLKKIFEYLETL